MKIPLVDLRAQYHTLRPDIQEAVTEVIESMAFIGGPAVSQFERAFADYCQTSSAVGCSSGTTALHLAFMGLGIKPGDEVIVPSHTFIATAEMLPLLGAKVRFAEIDETTYNIDPNSVRELINERTRLVVAVHLYGQPADMDSLRAICDEHDIMLMEDAAQAHGALYKGRRVGGLATPAAFSFYPGKNLGAYGDAGIVTAASEEMATQMSNLANHGRRDKYLHNEEGFNYRMDTIQAAVLLVKLRHLDKWNEARRHWASRYTEKLAAVEEVITPRVSPDVEPVFHLYVIRVPRRDAVLAELHQAGIGAGIHYPVPLHLQPAYRHIGMQKGDLPITERVASEIISLPMFAELDEEKVDKVVEALKAAIQRTS
ncbi:MAG: DegT/DnrJ/EryC1/StrS family aminotransferase [Candidatus Eisenbacteria bacterium]|uniref:DegT/DnrJ/EryC1/StrS family aminotransferase n=1 Tax=Eiseniibacteriota bacterium TaxID=2212470 RepID=A0A948RT75_UNCEI|nr:DegT/DnrJ/EryC1/StrS family aminotransferase [Candidatus Eisenbacteria bacterium]MBU1949410.1 DegT/DnrJ/EryC1/StrS family aminotransferase [Candidatus Eisenbacteria bacterium]MBU2689566.1 DegT/DnrJ/EryC1/StrS family aminotransferase [Candidatus Eisenbacteria bacterium]